MNWTLAVLVGAGLGLVCFGGLWLTVQGVTQGPLRPHPARLLLAWSSLVRLALLAVGFSGLSREGPDKVLAGLGGLWLVRWCLIRQVSPHRQVGGARGARP